MVAKYLTEADVQQLMSPLKIKVEKLEYKLQKTTNELFKLKDSLVYRDMAARVTH
jgi:hypothetical protein